MLILKQEAPSHPCHHTRVTIYRPSRVLARQSEHAPASEKTCRNFHCLRLDHAFSRLKQMPLFQASQSTSLPSPNLYKSPPCEMTLQLLAIARSTSPTLAPRETKCMAATRPIPIFPCPWHLSTQKHPGCRGGLVARGANDCRPYVVGFDPANRTETPDQILQATARTKTSKSPKMTTCHA